MASTDRATPGKRRPLWQLTLAALACALIAPQAAAAANFTVNDDTDGADVGPPGADCANPDFSTLQGAEDGGGVDPGDNILVCAGTYDDGDGAVAVEDDKGLTWRGAQAGVDARDRAVPDDDEALVDDPDGAFTLFEDDATVDGFKIANPVDGIETGLRTSDETDDQRIINNIVEDADAGFEMETDGGARSVARHNRFTNDDDGILAEDGLFNARISENLFTDHADAIDLFADDGEGLTSIGDVEIEGNEIADVESGIELSSGADVGMSDNTIEEFEEAGIELAGSNEGIAIEANTISSAGAEVAGGGGPQGSGVLLSTEDTDDDNEDVNIVGNTITDNQLGIGAEEDSLGGGITAHFNRIVNNQIQPLTFIPTGGILNEDPLVEIEAENNWFGCNEGPLPPDDPNPNDCDTVGGNVDADPWLVLDLTAKDTDLRPNERTRLKARVDRNSDGEKLDDCLFPDGTTIDFEATKKAEVLDDSLPTDNCKAKPFFQAGDDTGNAKAKAFLDAEKEVVHFTIED